MTNKNAGSKELMVQELFGELKPTIMDILPKHIRPERFFMIADQAIRRNEKLMQCGSGSMTTALIASAELGFEPGGAMPFAHLVPYKNKNTGGYDCQLIIDYRGLIDLAKRGGSVQSIESHLVFSRDQFQINYGTTKGISHSPVFTGDRGNPVGAYAIAYVKDGEEPQFDYMTKDEIIKIKNRSASKEGPWKTDELEMWRKTVVRRLCKYLITSESGRNPLLAKGLALEDRAELGQPADDIIDVEHKTQSVKETPVQQPKEKQPGPKPESNPEPETPATEGVTITDFWKKEGVYKSGKRKGENYNLYYFKDSSGRTFHTFDSDVSEFAYKMKLEGKTVDIQFTDAGDFGLKAEEIIVIETVEQPVE